MVFTNNEGKDITETAISVKTLFGL